jgi:hypothetical protein
MIRSLQMRPSAIARRKSEQERRRAKARVLPLGGQRSGLIGH